MRTDFYEVIKDGEPLSYLFYTPEQAWSWIRGHDDGAQFDVQKFILPKKEEQ